MRARAHNAIPGVPCPWRIDEMNGPLVTVEAPEGLVRTTHLVYALHALGLAIGAFGAASVVGSFVFGWPSIIAVIINYVKRGDARGTWLESHFDWQIRTFWIALGLAVLIALVSLPLALVIVGFATWAIGLFLLGVWAIYRIASGWLKLKDHQPMPSRG
jgi:uncharacterized membrane protein